MDQAVFCKGRLDATRFNQLLPPCFCRWGQFFFMQIKEFGPVSQDGSIKIYGVKKFPWGSSASAKKTVTKNTSSVDVTPNPFLDKKYQAPMTNVINQFAKQTIQAEVKLDPSVMTTATSSVVKDYTETIEEHKDFDETVKGEALGTVIDYGTSELYMENGMYMVDLPVRFHQKRNEYGGFNMNDGEPLEEEYLDEVLTLEYHPGDKKWYVANEEDMDSWEVDMESDFQGKHVVTSNFQ
jgi:hypothetical protein